MKIFLRSLRQIVSRPVYWAAMFILPLFCILLLTTLMEEGLPMKIPSAMVDKDGTSLSRELTQNLGSMQLIDLTEECNSYTEARHLVQEGKIYGFFMIPENFESDLLAGKSPVVTFYTNMTFYVPASLSFKAFKTTALISKVGIIVEVVEAVGGSGSQAMGLLQPVSFVGRPIGNPDMNYAVYLANSFLPCVLQLMIMLVTCFSLGQEIKYGRSRQLMDMANGSVLKAVFMKLLPETLIWWVMILFLESWLYCWQGYPMHGSWFWFTLGELMYVPACQGMALILFGITPNLRLSLSLSALLGILCFSVAAFSFPEQNMYPSISIFSWMLPARYNFLIYIDQALNGRDLFFSRWWYVAYIAYMVIPLLFMGRIKKAFMRPVYVP
ncbi:MAG: ABC transporter permease [Muribaculaceae bacterium]|nr:ABC transporter permease [Muribaculaceae bacterium]